MHRTVRLLVGCCALALGTAVRAQEKEPNWPAPIVVPVTDEAQIRPWARLIDTPVSDAEIKDEILRVDIERLRLEILKYRQAAAIAWAAEEAARDKANATKERIDVHDRLRKKLGAEAPIDALLAADKKVLGEEREALTKAEKERKEKDERYWQEMARFSLYWTRLAEKKPTGQFARILSGKEAGGIDLASGGTTPAAGGPGPGSVPGSVPGAGPAKACSLDTRDDRRIFDPVKCARHGGGTPTLTSLPDRVLDRRGFTTQLAASSDSSNATLKYTGTINFRWHPLEAIGETTGHWNIAYSLGVQTEIKEGKNRLASVEEGDSLFSEDRLNPGTKFQGSISANLYPRLDREEMRRDATNMAEAARVACLADQQKAEPTLRQRSCAGQQLVDWIFALDPKTGGYANQTHVDAFNKAYWGAPDAVARWGGGLSWEVGRSNFDYLPLVLRTPEGSTKQVVDLDNLPEDFLKLETRSRRRWEYSVGGFLFWRLPWEGWLNPGGTTLIPSLTYKRSFAAPDKIEICAAPATGATAVTNENCRTERVADAVPRSGLAWSIEVRNQFPGWRSFPGIGVAPKYTFDDSDDRNTFSVPVWLSFEKGSLNGGLNLAYGWGGTKVDGSPQKDDWGLSIFVGKTFNLGSGQ